MRVDYPAFGHRVRAKRMKLGLSQQELADLIDVSYQYIGQLERGERTPSVQTSVSLCYALQISLNALYEDSLPEDMFNEETNTLRQGIGLLHNTLSNWVLTDLPDESNCADLPADLSQLPPLGFELLDENPLFLH